MKEGLSLGGGGYSQMKRVGMLVASFRGVNFGFWSHLGCPQGKTPSFIAVKISFRVVHNERNVKKYI